MSKAFEFNPGEHGLSVGKGYKMKKIYEHTYAGHKMEIEVEFIPFKMSKTEISRNIYDVLDAIKDNKKELYSQIENITTEEKGIFLRYDFIKIDKNFEIHKESQTFLSILFDASYYLDVPCTIRINGKILINDENGLGSYKPYGYLHNKIIFNAKTTCSGEYVVGNLSGSMLSPISVKRESYVAL